VTLGGRRLPARAPWRVSQTAGGSARRLKEQVKTKSHDPWLLV